MANEQRAGLLGAWDGLRDTARERYRTQRQGIRNAIPGQPNYSAPQMFDAITSPFLPGNWYASQNEPGDRWLWERAGNNIRDGWNSFLGGMRNRGSGPLPGDPAHGPMPNYGNPNAAPPSGLPTMPNYAPPTAYGPPAPIAQYGNGQGMFPNGPVAQPGRQGQAGRFGTTIATGQNAVTMARGFARTGLGASSYGRDLMHRQQREG